MAVRQLHLVVLHRSLVILYRALVLQHQLLLVFKRLPRDGILRPRLLIAGQVHLCFGKQVLVPLQRPLRLRQLRRVSPWIDIDQRIALFDQLSLAIMHFRDHARDLRRDPIRIDRCDRPDRVQINA